MTTRTPRERKTNTCCGTTKDLRLRSYALGLAMVVVTGCSNDGATDSQAQGETSAQEGSESESSQTSVDAEGESETESETENDTESETESESETTQGGSCGDAIVDDDEDCDDAGESETCNPDCTAVLCGDGYANLSAGESCDDAGESATCDADCSAVSCGDGISNAAAGEACDDAGASATCDDDCSAALCGDGLLNLLAGETCDDGAATAACDGDCTQAVCGDGLLNVNAGEVCDDAGPSPTCNDDCSPASCGDQIVNGVAGETCDEGAQTATCDANCTAATCGDGTLNALAGEACDAGGESDTCNPDCTVASCGDGIANASAGEDCDDSGESAACNADCTTAQCGDSIENLSAGESCDEGVNTSGCDEDCSPVQCGDDLLNAAAGEACDDGNNVEGDGCDNNCVIEFCGDGVLQAGLGEACDDGNQASRDGCSPQCEIEVDPQGRIAAGADHTCVVAADGDVTCFGSSSFGQTGYPSFGLVGDNELPSSLGPVAVGGAATQIATGLTHTCARLEDSTVRCWGEGDVGRLGYGNEDNIGDDETPASAGAVDVGGPVAQVSAGEFHTCALMSSGAVRCWGYGANGRLGYGNLSSVGITNTPSSAGDIDLGGTATQIVSGNEHNCALLTTGGVRCWGRGSFGRLGYGNTGNVGDNETPASVGDVDIGGPAILLSAGNAYTCALLATGDVVCWGIATLGTLGYGNTETIGDDEDPVDAGTLDLGGPVESITTGLTHSCARLTSGDVRCWGRGGAGRLGYPGVFENVGDDELPSAYGPVVLGLPGLWQAVASGAGHSCALEATGELQCWGGGGSGRLGYGNTDTIGDDETPASAGLVSYE